jgi:hypothetical protein
MTAAIPASDCQKGKATPALVIAARACQVTDFGRDTTMASSVLQHQVPNVAKITSRDGLPKYS